MNTAGNLSGCSQWLSWSPISLLLHFILAESELCDSLKLSPLLLYFSCSTPVTPNVSAISYCMLGMQTKLNSPSDGSADKLLPSLIRGEGKIKTVLFRFLSLDYLSAVRRVTLLNLIEKISYKYSQKLSLVKSDPAKMIIQIKLCLWLYVKCNKIESHEYQHLSQIEINGERFSYIVQNNEHTANRIILL